MGYAHLEGGAKLRYLFGIPEELHKNLPCVLIGFLYQIIDISYDIDYTFIHKKMLSLGKIFHIEHLT